MARTGGGRHASLTLPTGARGPARSDGALRAVGSARSPSRKSEASAEPTAAGERGVDGQPVPSSLGAVPATQPNGSTGRALDGASRSHVRGLPVPTLTSAERPASGYYTVTAVDARGRLGDGSPLRLLRWLPAASLTFRVRPGVLLVTADPDGELAVTREGHLRLPADVRHALKLRAGDRLLLAAYPEGQHILAFTMPALESMTIAYQMSPGGDQP
jgi:hypothetical protein